MSNFKIIKPEVAMRLMELSQQAYRPAEILAQQAKIEAATKAGELNLLVTGYANLDLVNEIVLMKFELDALYCLWAERDLVENPKKTSSILVVSS